MVSIGNTRNLNKNVRNTDGNGAAGHKVSRNNYKLSEGLLEIEGIKVCD